uniref:sorting nexin-10-like n=1 Tax=Styela clava TaxID=7725 RepID=UPI001939ADC8|nr:sorting nexin-10-like [Styela clava]XP_039255083.1 sorting nexin-10-like [Styela clava]
MGIQQKEFKEYIRVNVGDPRIIENADSSNKHTVYEVELDTNSLSFTHQHSSVCRRYSEFVWLRNRLLRMPCTPRPPRLPMKSFPWNFNAKFLNKRKLQLQQFISRVLEETLFISCSALHLFLQTNLKPKKMDLCIENGKINQAIMASDCVTPNNLIHKINKNCESQYTCTLFTSITWKVDNNTKVNVNTVTTPVVEKIDKATQCTEDTGICTEDYDNLQKIICVLQREFYSKMSLEFFLKYYGKL